MSGEQGHRKNLNSNLGGIKKSYIKFPGCTTNYRTLRSVKNTFSIVFNQFHIYRCVQKTHAFADIHLLFVDTYFLPEYPGDQVYKATFRVVEGDAFSTELADPSTTRFKSTSRDYAERLNLLFRRSVVKHGYRGIDVLALDGLVSDCTITNKTLFNSERFQN